MSTDTMTPETALRRSQSDSDAVSGTDTLTPEDEALIARLLTEHRALNEHREDMFEHIHERGRIIRSLRARGMSHRRIAGVLGVTAMTVVRAERAGLNTRTDNTETPKDQETRS